MDSSDFSYVKYCDLEIVTLQILSNEIWNTQKIFLSDKPKSKKPVVKLYLCNNRDLIFSKSSFYRENVMRSGYYIGHHFGSPAYIKWVDEKNIFLACEDPGRIIWSYIIKVILTIFSQKKKLLHLKGSSIEYKKKAFLVLGRGGSGKTEFCMKLCDRGARLMGNTHALVKGNNVFGIKTNIRIRKNDFENYVSLNSMSEFPFSHTWTPIGAIFWIHYRMDGINNIIKLESNTAYQNMRWFSEAIGTWELKEDIADYLNSDPLCFSNYMESIDSMIRQLCDENLIYYINLDIWSNEGQKKVLDLMNTICKM